MNKLTLLGRALFALVAGLKLLLLVAYASVPGDEHWDNQFGPAGTSDRLYSLTTAGGNLYVGGLLTAAGNTKANFIAGYDGTNWFALNNGVNGGLNTTYIFGLSTDGTNVYAGGWFTNADGSGAKYLARWDGANWWPLGGNAANNPNSIVETVKVVGTNLYVGGLFTTNGGIKVNGIAEWNGSSWSALGAGISGGAQPVVEAIESDGTYVYAGGVFTQAGSVNATNVARWDGANWTALGTAVNGPVFALAKVGGYLYLGGSFTNSSAGITNLAKWDGANWSAVGGGGANRPVRSLITDGANLYVGGDFTSIGGITANRVAKWDGATWSTMGSGIQAFGVAASPGVYAMSLDTVGRLYVVGNFNQAGAVGASYAAGWDGTNWFALGGSASQGVTHFNGDVQSLLSDGVNLYAGGIFTEAGSTIVNGIGQWNGRDWLALGSAPAGMIPSSASTQVKALAAFNGYLYAGGSFTNIGGISASNIAQWDGYNWSPMGSGFNGIVYSLAVYKGVLFAGGAFTGTSDGSASLHGIAQWTGSTWADVPVIDAWRINNVVYSLTTDGNYLYAGGNFNIYWGYSPQYPTTGADLYNLAYWDGSFWRPIGSGSPNNTVAALAVANGFIYAGGSFTAFTNGTSVAVSRIAAWNGSSWTSLGSGMNPGSSSGSVSAVTTLGTNIYAAGSFTNAGGTAVQGVARWDGAHWSALGSGLYFSVTSGSGTGHSLAASGNDLFIGGLFSSAGDKPSVSVAHWNDQTNFYPPPNLQLTRVMHPANGQFQFRVAGTSGQNYIIQSSTNLNTWTSLQTNSATLYDFLDTNAVTYPERYYRAVLGP